MVWGPAPAAGTTTSALRWPWASATAVPSGVAGLSKKIPTGAPGAKPLPVSVTTVPGGPKDTLRPTTGGGAGDGVGVGEGVGEEVEEGVGLGPGAEAVGLMVEEGEAVAEVVWGPGAGLDASSEKAIAAARAAVTAAARVGTTARWGRAGGSPAPAPSPPGAAARPAPGD